MSAFTVSGRIEADASKFIAPVKDAKAANEDFAKSARDAAAAAETLGDASASAADRMKPLAGAGRSTAEIMADLQRAFTSGGSNLGSMQALVAKQFEGVADIAAVAAGATKGLSAANTEAVITHKAVAAAAGLNRAQQMELTAAVRHSIDALAAGASPLRVLALEGPKVLQALGSPAKALEVLSGALTPMRLLIGGVTGAALLGVTAEESYAASIRQVTVAILAHGNALGLTKGQYSALSESIAETANVSTRDARTITASLAASGIQSKAVVDGIAQSARGYAVAIGKDVTEATADLAAKIKDPAKGAAELGEQFGWLDGKTIDLIRSLQRKGEVDEAQKVLIAAVNDNTKDLAENVGALGRAFEWTGRQAANFWDGLGIFFSGEASQTLEQKMAAARQGLADIAGMATAQRDGRTSNLGQGNPSIGVPQIGNPKIGVPALGNPAIGTPLARVGGTRDFGAETAAAMSNFQTLQAQQFAETIKALGQKNATFAAGESRDILGLRDKYDTTGSKQREFDDDQTRLRNDAKDPRLSTDQRKQAQDALNASLKKEEEFHDQIAKKEGGAALTEQKRLAAKAEGDRTDLALLEQIYVARAAGDEKTARALEGQRTAAKQGFDLTTAQGREMAANAARALQLQAGIKSIADIQQRLGRLDNRFDGGANGLALKGDLDAAAQWRDQQLANLNQSEAHYEEWAADVQRIYRNEVAKAYDEDLRRNTDWVSGVARGLKDLELKQQDFASTAENGLKNLDAAGEEAFANIFKTGKLNLDRLLEAFEDTLAKMAWQKLVQPGFDSLAGSAIDWVGSLLGGGSSGSGAQGGAGSAGLIGHVGHTGMIAGVSGGSSRTVAAMAWLRAPRYHTGIDSAGGEVAAILKRGEGVFTPSQMDNADALIGAVANRPIVLDMSKVAGGQTSGGAQFNIKIEGGTPKRTEQKANGSGGFDLTIFLDAADDHIGTMIARDEGSTNAALKTAFNAQRGSR